MVTQHVEREDKYDVDGDWTAPDLAELAPATARIERHETLLVSRYFDTAQHDLLRHGITLRLLSGDTESGWQLKLPEGPARRELRRPADLRRPAEPNRRAVPTELRDVVYGISGGAALRSVARVDTARTVTRILDADGTPLAEVDDDVVTAKAAGTGATAMRWREVEVELGTGNKRLLREIGRHLTAAGAVPSWTRSKLARVLGRPAATGAGPTGAGPTGAGPTGAETLGDLIATFLRRQHAALVAGDLALRRGEDGAAVHATRIATRRYRSILAVFGDLFDPAEAAALGAELGWYAGLLGAVRERDVLRGNLDKTVAALPSELDAQLLTTQLHRHFDTEQRAAREELLQEMRGRRYLDLLATLDAWQQQPDFVEGAAAVPARRVRAYLDQISATLGKRLEQAIRSDADDDVLHRARKAAKRTRYTAELAAPVLGKSAARAACRVGRRAAKVQDVLGAHQDSVDAAGFVRRLGTAAGVRSNAFGYGVLYGLEQLLQQAARRQVRSLRW
jgi:CHAD domain-containing protein